MSSRSEKNEKRPHRRALKWGLGVLATLVILAAVVVGLFRVAANLLPRYHDQIAHDVSVQIGAPVKLGRISLVWHGWGPAIRFERARVIDAKTGKAVLSARSLRLDFTVFALLHGRQARPSGIDFVGPRVTLQQTATGGFDVPGLNLSGGAGGGFAAMLGDNIQITDGTLELRFADSSRPPWVFTSVNLDVGGGRTHSIDLNLDLPAPLGAGSLHAAGTLVTLEPGPAQWKWRGSFALNRLNLSPLKRFLPAAWPHPSGSLALDGKGHGTGARIEKASGRLAAQKLVAGKSRVNSVQTNFDIEAGDGYRLTLTDTLLLAPGYKWKPGRIFIGRTGAGRIQAGVARIDLAVLPRLGGFLPPALAALNERLHKMRPTGTVLDARFGLTPGQIASLDLSARLQDVGVYAAEGAPGFNHLAGSVSLQHGMGMFLLDAPGFTLRMPHVFPHTVPLDRAWGVIGVVLTDKGLRVAMPRLRLTGPSGLDGTIMAAIDIPRDGPVDLRMAASAAPVDVNQARALYMPTLLMPKPLAAWLMSQLHGGRVSGASMRLTGEARHFPFKSGGGHFTVNFDFRGTTLAPGPNWQPLEDLGGSVHFENAGLHAEVTHGKIAHARVVKSTATIADFFDPRLVVAAEVAGTLPDFIAFLEASPIGGAIKDTFARFEAKGAARSRLTLHLPVMHPMRFTLDGQLLLNDAEVSYAGVPYALKRLSGTLSFDGDGPTGGRLKARLLDAPVRLTLAREKAADATGGKRRLRIGMDGRFPLAVLSRAAGEDFARYASGSLPLHAELAVPLATQVLPLSVTLFSDLDGLALDLPAPAGKPASTRRPFAARLVVDRTKLAAMTRYAHVGSACADVIFGATQPVVRSAELMLGGGTCQAPASGYFVRGGWPELDVGAWLNKFAPAQQKAKKASRWTVRTLDVNLRFGKVKVFGQTLKDQTVRGTLGPEQMAILLDGPQLAGRVIVPREPDNAKPILAELTRGRFSLPIKSVVAKAPASVAVPAAASVKAAVAKVENARTAVPRTAGVPASATAGHAPARTKPSQGLSPRDIPPFSLHAAHLELGDAEFTDVKIVARRVPDGLLIKPIHVGGGVLKFDGQLVWLNPPTSHSQGALQFVAQINSLGKLLSGIGLGPAATGHGALSAGLAWRESPQGGDFVDELLGKVSADLRNGSISEVNPGAGRLLSLLNLANIPRYLVFNFNNLFGKGFPFSRIHGDYNLSHGVARTDGLEINSSVARIKITGSVDLVQGTLDQTAAVEPNYFGSLPVIGALVGGLGVGAAVYVLTKLFGTPLAKASEIKYSISGPFSHPVVKKVGAAPSASAPAASSGG